MDDFEDILEPRRNELDVRFALQSRDGVPEYKYTNKQTRSQVNESVLSSPRLKFTIDKVGFLAVYLSFFSVQMCSNWFSLKAC